MDRVRANATYFYDPCFLDKHGDASSKFNRGDKVRVVNLYGCPPANTMGHCYIVAADAKKNACGNYETFAMVAVGSLEKTKPAEVTPEPELTESAKMIKGMEETGVDLF
jgi:hypothetical protein